MSQLRRQSRLHSTSLSPDPIAHPVSAKLRIDLKIPIVSPLREAFRHRGRPPKNCLALSQMSTPPHASRADPENSFGLMLNPAVKIPGLVPSQRKKNHSKLVHRSCAHKSFADRCGESLSNSCRPAQV